MAQPIRPAEIQMDLVSLGTGMRNTTAPAGAQIQLDPTSNPAMSNQPFRQSQLAGQNVDQRTQDAMSQYMASNTRQQDNMIRAAGEADERARGLKNETIALILERSSAPASGLLFSDKGLTEMVTRDAMQNMAIGERLSPDLADYTGQLMA